jgi:hypothetical protein
LVKKIGGLHILDLPINVALLNHLTDGYICLIHVIELMMSNMLTD